MTKIDDKRVPALRFKGFNDDWAQRKLGKLSKIKSGQTPSSHDNSNYYPPQINWIRTGDLTNSKIISVDKLLSKKGAEKLTVFPKNTVVIAMYGGFNQIGRTGLLTFPSTINQALAAISPNPLINSNFLLQLLNKNIYTWRRVAASSRKDPNITKKDIENQKFDFPSLFEQEKISKLISLIDKLITLQQRKTEQLKLLKKAMLQKGFTNKSAPTLRFKGFSKAWTEYPLGNLGKACSGYGFPNSEQGGNKGIPFYKVSDMNLAGNEDEMIYANNYVTDAQIDRNNWKPIVDVPAIFFAKVGAAVLLNRKRLCKRPFLLDNNTMAYSLNKNILSTQFTKSLFETINLPSFIQVGALPSYNTNDIESIKVKIPKIDEQEKIGILLKKIERLITRQQSKIKKLHSTKQFLLQNMFI